MVANMETIVALAACYIVVHEKRRFRKLRSNAPAVSIRVSFGTDERLQSSDAPLSFEVIPVAQICNNHATVYVHELIAVSVQKANA